MSEDIFRKSALERLSSPEQLDRLVTVTSPKTWLALLMLCVIVAAAIAWSIFGRLPTRVEGNGILISNGGRVVNVQAAGNGLLMEIHVNVGDVVEVGQVVARLSQTDAEQNHRNAQAVLEERLENQARTQSETEKERTIKHENIELRRRALRDRLASGEQRVEFLRSRLADEESLVARKIITRDMVANTRDEANRAAHDIAEVRNGLAQLESEKLELAASITQRRRNAEEAVNEARRQVTQIQAVLSQATIITSAASGVVTEVKVSPGALVTAGQSLFTLQSGGQYLDLVLYIPPAHGKRIKLGMAVQISPSTAKREEFGTVKGEVEWISDFPASAEGMRAVLQNDELAQTFSRNGPPYVARVKLLRDSDTISGYRWSSAKGATLPLSGGTLASAEVTVAEQAPITLIIPLLREYTGIF